MNKFTRYAFLYTFMVLSTQVLNAGLFDTIDFYQSKQYQHPFIHAIQWSNDDKACELMSKGIFYDYVEEPRKMTAFLYACQNGCPKAARMLLESSKVADINQKNSEGYTALHFASRNQKTEKLVSLLLAVPNIKINALNNSGESPLNQALLWAQISTSLKNRLCSLNTALILMRAEAQCIGDFDRYGAGYSNESLPTNLIAENCVAQLAYTLFFLDSATTAEELQKTSQCLEIVTRDAHLVLWPSHTGPLLRAVIEERFIPKAATLSPELQEHYLTLLAQLYEFSQTMQIKALTELCSEKVLLLSQNQV